MKYKKHIIYEEKECPVCGKMFSGLRECCSNKCYQHQYYLKTIEARKEYKRKYNIENREKIKERYQKYINNNKEIIKEKQRKYYKEHRKELLEKQRIRQKEFYKEHRDELLEKSRKWRKANPEKSKEICRNQYWRNKEKGLTRIRIDGKLKWVERPKIYCITCGKEIDNAKKRDAKYCDECKKAIAREKYYKRIASMTEEELKEYRKKQVENSIINYHKRIAKMTPEQLEEHRRKDAERARMRYWKKKQGKMGGRNEI